MTRYIVKDMADPLPRPRGQVGPRPGRTGGAVEPARGAADFVVEEGYPPLARYVAADEAHTLGQGKERYLRTRYTKTLLQFLAEGRLPIFLTTERSGWALARLATMGA